ncbi:hypothetical protein CP533_4030 [Ophiocordyceps camponoti-saundersi (nom. inval.)]|nr:hypothetical protein CP533_4030 [Ophiocordyceps camponoti-saundersi (nom. inval.)]
MSCRRPRPPPVSGHVSKLRPQSMPTSAHPPLLPTKDRRPGRDWQSDPYNWPGRMYEEGFDVVNQCNVPPVRDEVEHRGRGHHRRLGANDRAAPAGWKLWRETTRTPAVGRGSASGQDRSDIGQ